MDPLTALVVLLAVSALYGLMALLGRNEVLKRTLACPRTGAEAQVDVVQRYQKPAEPVRVARCSLLPDPERVDCGQECLERAG